MLAEILDRTIPNATSPPPITGNDIPDDVWRIVVRLVSSEGSITQYMGVNRTFYNYALDQRYREVRWVVLDQDFVKQLDRLQSPLIAQHVHTLHIRAWFIQYLLKRDILFDPPSSLRKAKSALKDSLLSISSKLGIEPSFKNRGYKPQWMLQHERERSKDGPLSFETMMKSMIQAVAGMTNVVEFNFEWRDLPLNKDTLIFLTSTRTAFGNSLRKLTLRAPITKFRTLLPNTNFDNIEELDFHFDYRTGYTSETSDPDVQNLLDTIIPFINQRRSSLQSLTISSSSSTDLSSFFGALPDFTSLRRFGFDISFHRDFLSDLTGIIQLLESCGFSLRHVSLSANWEHGHLGHVLKSRGADNERPTISDKDDNYTQSQSHNQWGRMNNLLLAHPRCLSYLQSLEIPFVSLSETTPLIRRSCDNLTRLCLTSRSLTKNEVAEVVGLFSHRSLELQRLQLPVALLDWTLLLMLATRLPDLISLVLAFENLGNVSSPNLLKVLTDRDQVRICGI
ncbi:hypothetical protein CVT25_015300 [Psilocybe cyanescens]|uniref:Uncharacterized protein n=1 Tax=Psilocybe cyanescens TaxID=93625 RepID=A0A409WH08_PSICY|nr:hypothetical protein CVT25_015300 [Psilocybe cyanescens]